MSVDQTNVQLSNHGGVSFSFLPKGEGGGANEIVWIIGGGSSMYPCAKHVAN